MIHTKPKGVGSKDLSILIHQPTNRRGIAVSETHIQIRHAQATWSGSWRISNGLLHLKSKHGSLTAPVGGGRVRPKVMAEILLRRLAIAALNAGGKPDTPEGI
jgi:hypothetical protein